jgi:magnesium transporter
MITIHPGSTIALLGRSESLCLMTCPSKNMSTIMLSTLCRFEVTGADGSCAKLSDLIVSLDDDYPLIKSLYVWKDGQNQTIDWGKVKSIDFDAGRILVEEKCEARPATHAPDEVLLKDEIMDALVIDLVNRRAMRANDLCLSEEDGELRLYAVDGSANALFHRLSRGLLGRTRDDEQTDWKQIEFLRGNPRAVGESASYHRRITRLQPAEIARLSEALPYLHAAELLMLLPDSVAADVLEAMTDQRELQVFEELDEDQARRLLALMAPDAAADLVGKLPLETMKRHLDNLPALQSERIIALLRYPKSLVGGVMTNDIVFVSAKLTVEEALEALRERLKEPDFIYFIYIVDDDKTKRLRGVISLRDLIIADKNQRLEELMNPFLTLLSPFELARTAADTVLYSHLAALPVVGKDRRILGAMTVDAAVEQAAPRSWSVQAPKVFS